MRSRSVSLTGVTGFVGWHVAEALRRDGWHVRGLVRPGNTRPTPAGIEVVHTPLARGTRVSGVEGSDLVVHCAGLTRARDEAAFAAVNVDGTGAVVEAANAAGARIVLVSSQAAGGAGTPDRPRRETDDPRPVNAYGRSKLGGEAVVRARASVPWTIVRPCAVYGPRDRGFLPLFRLARFGAFPLIAPAAMAFSLIEVSDLARAIVLLAKTDRATGETLFLGHPTPQTGEDILRTLAHTARRTYRPLSVPAFAVRLAASAGDAAWRLGFQPALDSGRLAELQAEGFVCAVDRAGDVLGFTASTPFSDGIERTAEWYRAQRWI